jgi:hypothetical protein
MNRGTLWVLPTVVVLAFVAGNATAQGAVACQIPVYNWDFEMAYDYSGKGAEWEFSTSSMPDELAIPGWTRVFDYSTNEPGIYDWTGVGPCTYFAVSPDPNVGLNCAYSNGGEIRQILDGRYADQGVPVARLDHCTDYMLTVDGGWMTGEGGGQFNGRIELWAGEVMLGSETMVRPVQGYWAPTTLTIDARTIAALDGVEFAYNAPLEIRLISTSSRTCFDNVQLWATPVPEPATMSLLALGGLALLRRKR